MDFPQDWEHLEAGREEVEVGEKRERKVRRNVFLAIGAQITLQQQSHTHAYGIQYWYTYLI